jgi:hypothetical protein
MNLKGFGRKWFGPVKILPWHMPQDTEENHEKRELA